jgi:hypothetical protein
MYIHKIPAIGFGLLLLLFVSQSWAGVPTCEKATAVVSEFFTIMQVSGRDHQVKLQALAQKGADKKDSGFFVINSFQSTQCKLTDSSAEVEVEFNQVGHVQPMRDEKHYEFVAKSEKVKANLKVVDDMGTARIENVSDVPSRVSKKYAQNVFNEFINSEIEWVKHYKKSMKLIKKAK